MKKEKHVINFDEVSTDKSSFPHFYDEIIRDENGEIVAHLCKRWPKDKKK